jgi:hypothetical protein
VQFSHAARGVVEGPTHCQTLAEAFRVQTAAWNFSPPPYLIFKTRFMSPAFTGAATAPPAMITAAGGQAG